MSITKLIENAWSGLQPRQRDILAGRFGVGEYHDQQTLAALGERYSITRERVRQIEASALAALKEVLNDSADAKAIQDKVRKAVKEQGGVASVDQVLAALKGEVKDLAANGLQLVIRAMGALHYHAGDERFEPAYATDTATFKAAVDTVSAWIKMLEQKKDSVLSGPAYKALMTSFAKERGVMLKHLEQLVTLSKKLVTNAYGETGLKHWSEVNPRTVRDQIYLILRKHDVPLHFEEIATAINKSGIAARPALSATVHNELIKDERFVLVGRGKYALAEAGFVPGTAREVVHRILTSKGPLQANDVIEAVQKERLFKPNTILVNLQNRQHFTRNADGTYQVREA